MKKNLTADIQKFNGPIFIIGVSRSGTKLLRDLLNNHHRISISTVESKFIPAFYNKYGNWTEEQLRNRFNSLYNDFRSTLFFERIRAAGGIGELENDGKPWFDAVSTWTFAGVTETLFRFLIGAEDDSIWGDKTPNYLLYIPLLKELYPRARFLHIIRDVRDICLSAEKAWKRNIYFTAQRWYDYVRRCREDAAVHAPGHYFELKYEDLLTDPEEQLKRICEFLAIDFQNEMAHLKAPAENIGDAKNQTVIVKDNFQKWKSRMDMRQLKKIERIAGPLLLDLGYLLAADQGPKTPPKRLNPLVMNFYRVSEVWHTFFQEYRKNNLGAAFKTILMQVRSRL